MSAALETSKIALLDNFVFGCYILTTADMSAALEIMTVTITMALILSF